jgi:hypothetical protein
MKNLQQVFEDLMLEILDSGNPDKGKDLIPKEADAEVLRAIKKALIAHNMTFDEYVAYMKEQIK